ncbi:MAG: ferredoxin [Comamonadaceae bacterium]|nr:MAG: ferredoxin [Comamonadaceae bacterium]
MPHTRPTTHTLHFPELDRSITAQADESIFQSARRQGLRLVGACGGRGTCGTCVVRVTEGRVDATPASAVSDSAAIGPNPTHSRKKWLRACQIHAHSDCSIEVAPRSLAPVVRAEADTTGVPEMLALDASVCSHDITMPAATLADNLSDADRVLRALGQSNLTLDLKAAQALSPLLRKQSNDEHWSLRVRQRGQELIDFAPRASRTLGLAVDLGTTNAAAFLVDLETGARLASLGIENPQTAWGADLISRINNAVRSDTTREELRASAVTAINALAHDLCHAVGANREQIVDAVVCGNTAMHHLLLGLPVVQLGRAPFVATARGAMDLKARELGLSIAPGAWVHVVANVGGFVGGDHVTALLATQNRWQSCRTALVMDIGTNTEISLIHGGRILSASCPSGPALEGGHISCGMRAAEGAIERVSLEDGRITVRTIGSLAPVGLCGSGVLDALAVLRAANIVNARGRLAADHPDVQELNGQRVAVLAPGVHFSQDDVRAVQLAKAAIRTGVDMLLQDQGLHEQDIERFIIAGAFGAYIDITSGIAIGLFPKLPMERFEQVGNAAGLGVRQMLANQSARVRATELAATCEYVELSTRSEFQKVFLHHIGFPS